MYFCEETKLNSILKYLNHESSNMSVRHTANEKNQIYKVCNNIQ